LIRKIKVKKIFNYRGKETVKEFAKIIIILNTTPTTA